MSFLKKKTKSKKMIACEVVELLNDVKVGDALVRIIKRAMTSDNGVDEKKTDVCENGFYEAEEKYKKYLSIPDSDKKALSNVLKSDNALSFVVSGCIDDNLSALWDYCRMSVLKGNDIGTLQEILWFFFGLLNSTRGSRQMERLEVVAGDVYHDETCLRDADSAVQGKVTRVLLTGYKYAGASGRVIKRSLVHIGKGD